MKFVPKDRKDVSRVVASRMGVFGLKVEAFASDEGWTRVTTIDGKTFTIRVEEEGQ